uniref:Uncharacterized protein n=1 Tax=Arundo donax TaxID=35708 RepID=A0A0A9G833_ARUDO
MCVVLIELTKPAKVHFQFVFGIVIQKRQVVLLAHDEQCQIDSCLFCFLTSRVNLMLNFYRFT